MSDSAFTIGADKSGSADRHTAARDQLAARYFPGEWARVANASGKSKRRQQLRRAAEIARQVDELRAAGRSCLSCRSFCTQQIFGLEMAAHCTRQSDFHGYVEVAASDLCVDWHPIIQVPATSPSPSQQGKTDTGLVES